MTPLAAKVANELTLPKAQRRFDDQAGVLSLLDKDMHCFEVSALSKSVNDVLDGPLAAEDSDGAWAVWNDVGTMLPQMFLPSPVTWLEQVVNGKRIACVLREKEGTFHLITVHDGPRGGCALDMCKFRAKSVLEWGDRIELTDLFEEPDEREPETVFDLTKMIMSAKREGTLEHVRAMKQTRELLELKEKYHSQKVGRLSAQIDFMGAAHRFIAMCVLTIDLINTPGLIGLRQHDPHRGLARKLAALRGGSYPLQAWSEVVLKHQTQIAEPGERLSGATFHKCLHFVRSHLRHYRDGRVTVIPAHWRGDPALGIKRTRYRMAA